MHSVRARDRGASRRAAASGAGPVDAGACDRAPVASGRRQPSAGPTQAAAPCRRALRWILRDEDGATADRLIEEFGSLPALLAASPERWTRGAGAGAAADLTAFRDAVRHLLQFEFARKPLLTDWQGLVDYLRVDMACLVTERVRILHLNAKNMLIRDEILAEGTIDRAPIHAREVIRRAIDIGSAAIILVHNHPSGDPAPSTTDIVVTQRIAGLCTALGIAFIDHLIVGKPGIMSLRNQGHLA